VRAISIHRVRAVSVCPHAVTVHLVDRPTVDLHRTDSALCR
jgi:hypothetical protein